MTSRVVAIHQPECFPWLGFIDKAASADVFVILDDAQYVKNYCNNRNKVRTSQGWAWLTIPIETSGRSTQTFIEARMVEDGWRRKHIATWEQAYGAAKFAADYLPFLREHYSKPLTSLRDFNTGVIRWLFERFEIGAEVVMASDLACPGTSTDKLLELCRRVGAAEYLSGISGREYLDEGKFREASIGVRYQDFHHPVYTQRFEPFVPAMTSLDLLLNHGPAAGRILRDPATPRLKEVFT